mmetsp:Transcript_17995/g.56381  ORF Transcript_17995/g.56381 Transcript_17995/m.56381 type:complete len:284 (-) Transcript_17995:583-1434(-)
MAGCKGGSSLPELPWDILSDVPQLLDRACPVARLACTARGLHLGLCDGAGRLRVGSIVTCRLRSVVEGLARASLQGLQVLRVDLSAERRECLCRCEIECAVKSLGDSLASAVALQVLALRLASFDISMQRLRLGREAWHALTRGLGALAQHHRLRSLELSSMAIKPSRATQAAGPPTPSAAQKPWPAGAAGAAGAAAIAARASPSFLEAIARLSELEELVLTGDEILGTTAQLLPPAICELEQLRRVDLARNHISRQAMQAVRQAMPAEIELCGENQQTFFFY